MKSCLPKRVDIDGAVVAADFHSILDIGEGMLCSGAEVNRVEEMLIKMGAAYGVK